MAKKLLDFSNAPEKKNAALYIKIRPSIIGKLKEIAKCHGVSQSDVIEKLIEVAYEELESTRKKKRKK